MSSDLMQKLLCAERERDAAVAEVQRLREELADARMQPDLEAVRASIAAYERGELRTACKIIAGLKKQIK